MSNDLITGEILPEQQQAITNDINENGPTCRF